MGVRSLFPFLSAVAFCIAFFCVPSGARKKVDVYVAGFFPVGNGPKSALGRGVMPALNLAVKHVNEHPTILRNYKLHVVWNDTKCNTAIGTKAFFDMMYKAPRKVMLFGAACTHVTDPIANAARHWHITQLSYADTHPMFSSIKYPNFFRMTPSENDFNFPRIEFLQAFNWTRVGTLFQNEPRHALAHNHLISFLDKIGGYDILESQSFADELQDQLTKLQDKDVRIILGYFDEKWARRIFCEAYKSGMFGKNYQWIITGMYRTSWWTLTGDEDDESPEYEEGDPFGPGEDKCMVEEIMTALEGCVMMDLLPLSSTNIRTVSGKNISQYEEAYTLNCKLNEYSRFHGYTYDGVWAMALAIQAVGHKLHKENHNKKTNTTVQDFRYRDPNWEELFTKALSAVTFEGVTGHVQFTNDNTRQGYILLKQFQDGQEVKIGEYDGLKKILELEKGHAIYWPGGNPPLDRTVKLIEKSSVNVRIYAVLVTLSSLGIVMATIFLSINLHFRNQRYIKMSSPYLNNLIIIGCIFTYTSVILLGLDSGLSNEKAFPMICAARGWVLMSGFTLAFGSMFSKTWRVHSIFTNVQINKKVIKDYQLYIVVFVLLSIDIAIMTTWQFIDPFRRETKLLIPYMRGENIQVIPENEYCMSDHMSIFIGCIYAYKGLLMIFGCFLAWETRHVSIPALNDSKYIGMSVYNVVIMCVIGVPISYILSDKQDAMYLIISVFILFCTTGTLILVFGPKLLELKRNPSGSIDKRILRPTLKPPKRNDSDSDVSDLHDQIKKAETDRTTFTKKLKERDDELKVLIEQLGEEVLDEIDLESSSVGPEPILSKPPTLPTPQPAITSALLSTDRIRVDGPSITETTEATEMTSICSTTASQDEYVARRQPLCVASSFPTSTSTTSTTIHNFQQHPNYHQQQQPMSSVTGVPASGVPISSLDRAARRGPMRTSPEPPTPRDVTKSVSFRLEGNETSPFEAIPILHMSRTPSTSTFASNPSPQPPIVQYSHPYHAPRSQISPPPPPAYTAPSLPQRRSYIQQEISVVEREGAAYGGYGGVYMHDYRGPMIQTEQSMIPQDRRSSRGSLLGIEPGRMSRQDEMDIHAAMMRGSGGFQPTGYMPPHHIVDNRTLESSSLVPFGYRGPSEEGCTEIARRSSLKKALPPSEKYGQAPQNVYTPLNNESNVERALMGVPRKPADLTIINNTVASPQLSYKNINAHANLSATSSLVDSLPPPQLSILRRGSEPPRPIGRNLHMKNRSFDDLGAGDPTNEDLLLQHDRDGSRNGGGSRTISRAHLRRDSFGEVVSRRSPSQDSLEMSRARSSPEAEEGDIYRAPPGDHEDIWSSTASARHSPSQDSLQRQDYDTGGRVPSQESLGTMSSRGSVSGSVFSMQSARSDVPPRQPWSGREGTRIAGGVHLQSNHGVCQGSYLNGDLGESAASTDDLAHQAVREGFREPTGLHRTSSEPYYNFDSMDIPDGPLFLQQSGMLSHNPDYHQQYEPETRTLGRNRNHTTTHGYGGLIGGVDSGTLIGYTHSLRGRSHSVTRQRQTTSTVAAAIAAARAKNASDNALDHDTSILPIFQKLLSERQRSFSGRGRDYTMSSCPNITIKCDIVEYL